MNKQAHAVSFTRTLRLKLQPNAYAWLNAAAVEVNQVYFQIVPAHTRQTFAEETLNAIANDANVSPAARRLRMSTTFSGVSLIALRGLTIALKQRFDAACLWFSPRVVHSRFDGALLVLQRSL